jgi:hypothetical protein
LSVKVYEGDVISTVTVTESDLDSEVHCVATRADKVNASYVINRERFIWQKYWLTREILNL